MMAVIEELVQLLIKVVSLPVLGLPMFGFILIDLIVAGVVASLKRGK